MKPEIPTPLPPQLPWPPPRRRTPRAYRLLFGLAIPLGVVALALWYAAFSTAEAVAGASDRLVHAALVCGALSALLWIVGTFSWFAND